MSEHQEEENKQTVYKEEGATEEKTEGQNNKSSTGLDVHLAGLLCYLVGFITGIVFLVIEKENRFIRFHAMQSIITFAVLFVLNFVLTAVPVIGWLIGIIIAPLTLVLWIILMVKAYQGTMFKLPIVGDIAEKQLNKMDNKGGN